MRRAACGLRPAACGVRRVGLHAARRADVYAAGGRRRWRRCCNGGMGGPREMGGLGGMGGPSVGMTWGRMASLGRGGPLGRVIGCHHRMPPWSCRTRQRQAPCLGACRTWQVAWHPYGRRRATWSPVPHATRTCAARAHAALGPGCAGHCVADRSGGTCVHQGGRARRGSQRATQPAGCGIQDGRAEGLGLARSQE